jgi:hypothetical protein
MGVCPVPVIAQQGRRGFGSLVALQVSLMDEYTTLISLLVVVVALAILIASPISIRTSCGPHPCPNRPVSADIRAVLS